MNDAIEMIIDPRVRPVGSGTVRRVLPFRRRRMVGPFIFADIMGPEDLEPGKGADVAAHPHLGLSTLTYLLDGSLMHRDSTGVVQRIDPGEVNWMTAGSGACHTERTPPDARAGGSSLWGLQTWVALPQDVEDALPFFEHATAGDIPQEDSAGAAVRVLAGTGWGMSSPVKGSSPLAEAHITLDDAVLRVPAEHPERGIVAMSGDLRVGGQRLAEGQLAVLEPGSPVEVSGTGVAMFLAGDPVGERFIWWNFVASDRERIEQAKLDWDAQAFPLVPGDHDEWMPRPAS
jgi:hypothetical protein